MAKLNRLVPPAVRWAFLGALLAGLAVQQPEVVAQLCGSLWSNPPLNGPIPLPN